MSESVRLLNLGPTNWLRTQSVYRSTARLMAQERQDTIVMSTPLHAYLAVGGGHHPADVVDLAACAELDVPVVSSPLSAPLTYLDGAALVTQWVFRDQRPDSMGAALLEGATAALRGLGMEKLARSAEGLLAGGQPIVRVQTGIIGEASVVQADVFLQFDHYTAGRLLPDTARASLWTELSRPVSPEMLHTSLLDAFSAALGRPIERGKPSQAETRLSKQIDLELLREASALLEKEIVRNAED